MAERTLLTRREKIVGGALMGAGLLAELALKKYHADELWQMVPPTVVVGGIITALHRRDRTHVDNSQPREEVREKYVYDVFPLSEKALHVGFHVVFGHASDHDIASVVISRLSNTTIENLGYLSPFFAEIEGDDYFNSEFYVYGLGTALATLQKEATIRGGVLPVLLHDVACDYISERYHVAKPEKGQTIFEKLHQMTQMAEDLEDYPVFEAEEEHTLRLQTQESADYLRGNDFVKDYESFINYILDEEAELDSYLDSATEKARDVESSSFIRGFIDLYSMYQLLHHRKQIDELVISPVQ